MHTQCLLSTCGYIRSLMLFSFSKAISTWEISLTFLGQKIFLFSIWVCPYTVQKTYTACFCDALMFPVVILSFPVLFQIAQRVFVYGLLIGQHFCMFRFMPPPVLLAWFWVTCFFVFSCRQRHFWNESGKFKTIWNIQSYFILFNVEKYKNIYQTQPLDHFNYLPQKLHWFPKQLKTT